MGVGVRGEVSQGVLASLVAWPGNQSVKGGEIKRENSTPSQTPGEIIRALPAISVRGKGGLPAIRGGLGGGRRPGRITRKGSLMIERRERSEKHGISLILFFFFHVGRATADNTQ